MEAVVSTLTTAGSPRTRVCVEQRERQKKVGTEKLRINFFLALGPQPFLSSYVSIRSDASRIKVAAVYR